jgi:hypothetical protein
VGKTLRHQQADARGVVPVAYDAVHRDDSLVGQALLALCEQSCLVVTEYVVHTVLGEYGRTGGGLAVGYVVAVDGAPDAWFSFKNRRQLGVVGVVDEPSFSPCPFADTCGGAFELA